MADNRVYIGLIDVQDKNTATSLSREPKMLHNKVKHERHRWDFLCMEQGKVLVCNQDFLLPFSHRPPFSFWSTTARNRVPFSELEEHLTKDIHTFIRDGTVVHAGDIEGLWVIPPLLRVFRSRITQAACCSFCLGVIPPKAILGRSLL